MPAALDDTYNRIVIHEAPRVSTGGAIMSSGLTTNRVSDALRGLSGGRLGL